MKTINILWAILFSIALASCGGGGGSANPPATPTYSISGTVSGAVLQGVTINLTGGGMTGGFQATTTDASGNYSFTGLSGTGNYTVTPVKTGYVFSSNSTAVSINGANVTGTNFTSTANTAATYSISGTVSGLPAALAMITLSGGATGTTFTDYSGNYSNYSFSGLVNGSYTVTPSIVGNFISTGFSPTGTTVNVNSANVPNTNFAVTYTLSGRVLKNGGGMLQGVAINLTGPVTATTTTDANGNYTISGLVNGSYTVMPSLAGYAFSPAASVVSVSSMPPAIPDFYATAAAATYSISGTVSGAILKNVTITLSGANTGSVLTDANGNYTIFGLVNGIYTVIPSLAGYKFSPANSAITINGANATAINFVAAVSYRISGSVMRSGAALQGVTITLTGAANASTTTDMMGDYFFDGLANGSYTVTPSLAGYTFTPASSAITLNGANSTANNFVAVVAPVSYSISGTVSGAVLQGVTVNLTGASNASTTTDASGNYTISGLANGNYTVTPTLAGYTFTPPNRAVTINSANSTANNFVSAAVPVTYTISGTVSGAMQGETVNLKGPANPSNLTGTTIASTATDTGGSYSFPGLANGSYTVAPCVGTIPVSRAVTINGADSMANDFVSDGVARPISFNISGTVSGVVRQGVTINLTGTAVRTTTTGLANGNYSFCGLNLGSYTITPSLAGYTFSPSSSAVTIQQVWANSTANNFVSTNIVFVPVSPLPQATVGTAYSNTVVASISGGTPPYHYQSDSFATGAPPIGMIVDLNGNLTGTPNVAGTYTFGVCAVDLVGTTSCPQVQITVASPTSSTYYWANWNCGTQSQCATTMGAYTGSTGQFCTLADCNACATSGCIGILGASCSTTAMYATRIVTAVNGICLQSGVDF